MSETHLVIDGSAYFTIDMNERVCFHKIAILLWWVALRTPPPLGESFGRTPQVEQFFKL